MNTIDVQMARHSLAESSCWGFCAAMDGPELAKFRENILKLSRSELEAQLGLPPRALEQLEQGKRSASLSTGLYLSILRQLAEKQSPSACSENAPLEVKLESDRMMKSAVSEKDVSRRVWEVVCEEKTDTVIDPFHSVLFNVANEFGITDPPSPNNILGRRGFVWECVRKDSDLFVYYKGWAVDKYGRRCLAEGFRPKRK
ncbi:helix-turn-helix domain-containing protein [Nitrospirillum bahiense]|uniref:helix-turn-helix domain-containing protein n=1 Tax=Nitrospirillum amazonense TaxID=28077 RepID=UPI00119DBF2E|nr:helix-turn-helix transcriptional regulator [Nitrospirillum amazonense]